MVKVRENMVGWIMSEHGVSDSRLTVIEQAEDYIDPKGIHRAQWLCECSCEEHNLIITTGDHIKSGRVKSCGCLTKEQALRMSQNNRKYNTYDISGDYGIGWTTNTNQEFYFDLEDYDKIKDYCWHEGRTGKNRNFRILVASIPGVRNIVTMHKLLGFQNHDHIDRNEFNNQKANLRPCTKDQNNINKSIRLDNTSGVTGVYKTNSNKWEAYLKLNGETKLRKQFDDINDAIRARLQAEQDYFGEFAPQRHLFEKYNIKTIQNY